MSETVTRIGKPYDENDPNTYSRLIFTTLDDRPIEVTVTPTETVWTAKRKDQNLQTQQQLELADQQEIDTAKADEKVHKQFDQNSWLKFLGYQTAMVPIALGTSIAVPTVASFITNPYIAYPTNAVTTVNLGKDLVKNIPKTYNLLKNKDYTGATFSSIGNLADLGLTLASSNLLVGATKGTLRRAAEVIAKNAEDASSAKRMFTNIKGYNFKLDNPLYRNIDFVITGNRNNLRSFNSRGTSLYTGLHNTNFSNVQTSPDVVQAYLYREDLPKHLFTKLNTGKDFGVFENYINKHYSQVKSKIPSYEVGSFPKEYETPLSKTFNIRLLNEVPKGTPEKIIKISGNTGYFPTKQRSVLYDTGGYLEVYSVDPRGQLMVRGEDIWKFNPSEYVARYPDAKPLKPFISLFDNSGTPIISRTVPRYVSQSSYKDIGYNINTQTFN